MPSLVYFDLMAKAEAIRMLLSHAGQEYNDLRIPMGEWDKYKFLMPATQVPIWIEPNEDTKSKPDKKLLLPVGEVYNHSGAILRMLAGKLGYGSDDVEEMYHIDWAFETFNDYWTTGAYKIYFMEDPPKEKLEYLQKSLTRFHK